MGHSNGNGGWGNDYRNQSGQGGQSGHSGGGRKPGFSASRLKKLPKWLFVIVAIIVIIVGLVLVLVLLPVIIGLIQAILSGDVTKWVTDTSNNLNATFKPVTDLINTVQGIGGGGKG